jgi:NADPH2:quinone reductase
MKAVQLEEFGGPEVMAFTDIPQPQPEADELLIEIRAAGVNRVDILTRSGAYHGATQLPMVLGREGSGIVREVGSAVTDFASGDRVLAFLGRPGYYAELVAARAEHVVRMPDSVDWPAAAALPTAWLTSWYCVRNLAQLQKDETILIQAAASGVGEAAVQIAKHLGGKVIAAAGSDEKVAWAQSIGADWGINYSRQDIVAETKAITGDKGVEVVLDAVGGLVFPTSLKVVGHGGRVVALANVTLEDSVVNTRDFYPKNAIIYGFQLSNLREHSGYDARTDLEELVAVVGAGKLQVNVDRVLSLAEAAEAHRYLEERRNRGKVILIPGG